jgi:hypothetical protein
MTNLIQAPNFDSRNMTESQSSRFGALSCGTNAAISRRLRHTTVSALAMDVSMLDADAEFDCISLPRLMPSFHGSRCTPMLVGLSNVNYFFLLKNERKQSPLDCYVGAMSHVSKCYRSIDRHLLDTTLRWRPEKHHLSSRT